MPNEFGIAAYIDSIEWGHSEAHELAHIVNDQVHGGLPIEAQSLLMQAVVANAGLVVASGTYRTLAVAVADYLNGNPTTLERLHCRDEGVREMFRDTMKRVSALRCVLEAI